MNPDQREIQAERFAARFRYAPGSTPLQGYTIQRGIGIGGFGEVYFATSNAGKEVALKRIQRNLDVELRGVQNCLNLKHLNLISLFDILSDDSGDSWVVMEYVPGPSLRDIIEVHESGMPGHQIQRWFAPIASGVGYLHDSGIVHRDLKPANIFLDEDEDVIKIGDYGLSKFISNSHRSGQTETVGTFHYMAPEVGKGVYGKGVDVYAMGIVLYEMLTGDVPFEGESQHEIIMKHLTADPDLSAVPFDFKEAIRRALLKDPEERFHSIQEFEDFLPWSNQSNGKPVLNAERFVLPTNYKERNGKTQSENSLPNILQRSATEDGILFGPLRDSFHPNADNRNNEIVYIEDNETVESPQKSTPAISERKEPIAEAFKSGWIGFSGWLSDSTVSIPLKVFALLLIGFVVTANSQWLLPMTLGLGFAYLVYFGIRNLVLSPVEGELHPKKLSRRRKKQLVHEAMRTKIQNVEVTSRTTTLIGGLLSAATICIALNLLGLAITESLFSSTTNSWALFAWSAIVSIAASWCLLLVGRVFEVSDGQWFQRRISMIILGVILGVIAFASANYFNVDFGKSTSLGFNPLNESGLVFSGSPLIVSILFFAAMFASVRWWRQVDPTRKTQLSIWTVGLCLIWSALFAHLLDFAPLLSCIVVVIVSITIQLASPWIPNMERQSMAESITHSKN